MIKLVIASIIISAPAYASEVTLVKSDNTTIRTVHHYGKPQFEVETADVDLKDPTADAECFDRAKSVANRRDRYALLERCLGS